MENDFICPMDWIAAIKTKKTISVPSRAWDGINHKGCALAELHRQWLNFNNALLHELHGPNGKPGVPAS
jgi:hypothetical protein